MKQMKQQEDITGNNQTIKVEGLLESYANPATYEEIQDLYSYKSAICKIFFETLKDGKKVKGFGTGFFCDLDDKNIPFKKALFSNHHILDENSIQINKQIEFESFDIKNTITITKERKAFTNKELDYTCIEILDTDEINSFFIIDKTDKDSLKKKEIFILQYPEGVLKYDCGRILDVKNNRIEHSVSTKEGLSGSPLIKRYNNKMIVGIHCGAKPKEETGKSVQKNDKKRR